MSACLKGEIQGVERHASFPLVAGTSMNRCLSLNISRNLITTLQVSVRDPQNVEHNPTQKSPLTLMLLVANLANTKWCKQKWQTLAHGTHLRVLIEGYPMNTNMTGFRCLSKIFVAYALDKYSLSIGMVIYVFRMYDAYQMLGLVTRHTPLFFLFFFPKCLHSYTQWPQSPRWWNLPAEKRQQWVKSGPGA